MPEKPKSDDALAREVDRLLRKLPGADPYLKGETEFVATRSPSMGPEVAARYVAGVSRVPVSRGEAAGVWVRVSLGLLLAGVVTQWPYASGCGLGLSAYLLALTMVVVSGTWGLIWSWRYRMPWAHFVGFGVVYWGVILIANQVLQRVGYAAAQAVWACR